MTESAKDRRARQSIEALTNQLVEMREDRDRLQVTADLAERCARAKGRYHGQHAMCDLMNHFGVPCVRPGEDAEMATCACGDSFPIESYGAGFMAANGGMCENCAAAEGVGDE